MGAEALKRVAEREKRFKREEAVGSATDGTEMLKRDVELEGRFDREEAVAVARAPRGTDSLFWLKFKDPILGPAEGDGC